MRYPNVVMTVMMVGGTNVSCLRHFMMIEKEWKICARLLSAHMGFVGSYLVTSSLPGMMKCFWSLLKTVWYIVSVACLFGCFYGGR